MFNNVKVSVALCTYNGAAYIEEQIKSILAQTRVPDEIVLCDDLSSDDTVEIARNVLEQSDVSYRIEVNTSSLGVSDNFLKALKMTDGDWVFTCDQDDIWNANKVEIFLKKAQEGTGTLYFSNGLLVDGSGNTLNVTLWEAYGIQYANLVSSPLFLQIIKSPVVTGAAMMVSRDLIDSVDFVPKPFLHDEWLSVLASARNGAVPIDLVAFSYRQHGKNVVGAKKRSFYERFCRWSDGFRELKTMRRDRYLKAKAILPVAEDTEYAGEARDSLAFWKELDGLSHASRFCGVKSAIQLYRAGYYRLYYTHVKGFVRDILAFIFF